MSIYGTPPEQPEPIPTVAPDAPPMPACTACGSTAIEQGFVEDGGEQSHGFSKWIPGPLERGMFGGARRMGKPRFEIVALRCTRCYHLDLYVGGPA